MTLRAAGNSSPYLGNYAFASLPAASDYPNFEAFATDYGANGTKVKSNGTRWLPVNGQTVVKRLGAPVSGIANTETIVTQIQFPIGSLQTNDMIRITMSDNKSGATDSFQTWARVGTTGTVADTLITGFGTNTMTAASTSGGILFGIRVVGTTSMQKTGGNTNNTSAYGANGATAQAAITVGLADFSSNAVWLSFAIKSNSTTDTVGVQEITILHEVG